MENNDFIKQTICSICFETNHSVNDIYYQHLFENTLSERKTLSISTTYNGITFYQVVFGENLTELFNNIIINLNNDINFIKNYKHFDKNNIMWFTQQYQNFFFYTNHYFSPFFDLYIDTDIKKIINAAPTKELKETLTTIQNHNFNINLDKLSYTDMVETLNTNK